MLLLIGRILLLGTVATVVMDILGVLAHRAHITAPLPPTLIGRWAAYAFRGHPRLANIERSAPVAHELAIALLTHYVVGIVFGVVYLIATLQLGVSPRSAIPALAFGLVTSVFPWLLMFPAMGFGWFGMRGPAQTSLFVSSLIGHAAFGIGLWFGARASGVN